ncbi:SUMF1/EgtB/PvdO family nonheme iron enzyme [Bacteroides acidifaciens]|uniref:formylglycine-generating enzyme family protein n=1 Tax=Bacteroides acidifaciens TaxID=85831 RepID=UPI003014374B
MKNRFFLFFMVSIISLLISSCNDDEVTEAPIQVTTQGFARVGQSTAFVSAYITKGSISENAVTGFCWSEASSPTVSDSKVESAGILSENGYMLQIIGLSPSTDYYVRAYINDGIHIYYGNELKLTTKDIPSDGWCVIDDITKITPTTATALMQIADNGGSEVMEYGVCYEEISEDIVPPIVEPTLDCETVIADAGGYAFDADLKNLSQNTRYLVRPYFKTEEGVVYGETVEFKTMNFIKTGDVFPGYQSAYLYGEVLMDAGSPTTERGVCWGASPDVTIETSSFKKIDKGTGTYYSIVGGLQKGTTYYARAYARNSDGVFYGLPVEFTTHTGDIIPGVTHEDMILVENGIFDMGNPNTDTEASPIDNKTYGKEPVHKVNISKDFYVCRYEVTVEQMCVFLNVYQSRNSRSMPVKALHNSATANWCFQYSGAAPNLLYKPRSGKGRYPVVNLTWPCAEQYCEWLSAELGVKVRLPSEAEWEYAARGGKRSQGYLYSGSNNSNEVSVSTNNNTGPAQVGTKKPNELGIFDMTGNAMEYCRDFFDWNFYTTQNGEVVVDPVNAGKLSADGKMIVRGGSFKHPTYLKVYTRGCNQSKGDAGNHNGFRFVMEKLPIDF